MENGKTVKLKVQKIGDQKSFEESVKEFVTNNWLKETFAILYTPGDCLLLKLDSDGKFQNSKREATLKNVFEARIFNENAELRWLREGENGSAVILSEEQISETFGGEICLTNSQEYLVWGEISPNDEKREGWTEFAEARIGKFDVPINTTSRAKFTAIEYLKEFEDGNVAVFDERLTGISEVNNG